MWNENVDENSCLDHEVWKLLEKKGFALNKILDFGNIKYQDAREYLEDMFELLVDITERNKLIEEFIQKQQGRVTVSYKWSDWETAHEDESMSFNLDWIQWYEELFTFFVDNIEEKYFLAQFNGYDLNVHIKIN